MKTVAALTLGLLLGSAGNTFAISGWYSLGDLLDTSRTVRLGYAAGVADALTELANDKDNTLSSFWVERYLCMSGHGDRLGDFTDWADRKMLQGRSQYVKDQAAGFLMASLCEP